MTEERLDHLLNEIREENVPEEVAEAAYERVRRKLNRTDASPVCAEFLPDREAYLAGTLSESRRLLMDDHLSRCPDCRRVLADLRAGAESGVRSSAAASPRVLEWTAKPRRLKWVGWAAAAAVVLGGLYLSLDKIDTAFAPAGPSARIISVSGAVYQLPQKALGPGATLSQGEMVRTTAGARALLQLADGSRVEMNQRTELYVQAAWSGLTVRLVRGDVMVEAAKQRRGHLRVVTRDSTASVKGTVFGVSADTEGSMVSVVEGSVAVSQPGAQRLLASGEKSATNPALQKLEVRQAISWSQDAEKYYALLAEFQKISKEIEAAPGPALRHEAKLLRYVPAGMQVYVAIPNLNGTIRQALFQFDQRARENAVLNESWSSKAAKDMRETLDRVQAVTPYLGDEVVFVWLKQEGAQRPGNPNEGHPLILAEIQPGRHDALQEGMKRIADADASIAYKSTPDLLMISDTIQDVNTIAGQLGGGANSAFAAEIARRYQNGAGWLAGIDLSALTSGIEQTPSRVLGASKMRYLFLEQRSSGGSDDTEATLTFDGTRTGISSWLAPPGSAGSTEYISANAMMVFSASTKDPLLAFEDLLSGVGDFATAVQQFQSETGVNVGSDIASALGTDFTFSVERPTLPMPGWVAIAEVVRPGVLDDTVRRLVDAFNRSMKVGEPQIALIQETVNGRTWTSLNPGPFTIHWTYDRGYLVASTDRALATTAIAIRDSGSSLAHSSTFQLSFPASGGIHHSGFVWINTNGALAEFAQMVPNPALGNLLAQRDPILLVMDGETEQIHAASRTRLTSMMLNLVLAQGASRPSGPGERGRRLKQLTQ
ncbi:MAG TPA: FecR domain-containing protein [Bryobacteraceae bacterium]